MKKKYTHLLKDPKWQKMRLKIFERDNWQCKWCNDKNNTLHVHHLRYERGKMPWEYELKDLITLCECCHEKESKRQKSIRQTAKDIEKLIKPITVIDPSFLAILLAEIIHNGELEILVAKKLLEYWSGTTIDIVDLLNNPHPNYQYTKENLNR